MEQEKVTKKLQAIKIINQFVDYKGQILDCEGHLNREYGLRILELFKEMMGIDEDEIVEKLIERYAPDALPETQQVLEVKIGRHVIVIGDDGFRGLREA